MFKTEIIHYIQSFATDELTIFMQFITMIGYQEVLMLILLLTLLLVDFKKGFILSLILLWTASITYFLKESFNLPRPFHVDNTVAFLDGDLPDKTTFEFSKRGAVGFWGGLPKDVLEETRKNKQIEHGFPSGHSSIAIAFWGSLFFLFRNRWMAILSGLLMILIPHSRMYLGVHFLADVLGGIILGGLILGLAYTFLLRKDKLERYLKKEHYTLGVNLSTMLLLVSPCLFFFLLPSKVYVIIAYLLGYGMGFMLLSQKGIPESDAPWLNRLGRLIVGLLSFVLPIVILKFIFKQIGIEENIWVEFVTNLIAAIMFIWIGTEISIKIGWFRRDQESGNPGLKQGHIQRSS